MIASNNCVGRFRSRLLRGLKILRDDSSGIAISEFAYTMPIILSLGMLGTETAYYSITHMKVSQIAMQVADNASRVGDQAVLIDKQVFEGDINEVFIGADKFGGNIDFLENGRVILSSLQTYEDDDEIYQVIDWQRCKGVKNFTSSYGVEGDTEEDDGLEGMGDGDPQITASEGEAVMFVEVAYDYPGITPFNIMEDEVIRYTAAFNVRNSRDLTQLYSDGSTPSACDTFDSTFS